MDVYKNYDRQANWRYSNQLLFRKTEKIVDNNQMYETQQGLFKFNDCYLTFSDYIRAKIFYDYWGYTNI